MQNRDGESMITDQELTIPVKMEALCRHYKITKGRLAEELGYAEETISRWINGRSEPPEHMADTLRGLEMRLIKKTVEINK